MLVKLLAPLIGAALLLAPASSFAQTAPISPHCQKMMMIGCALTKNSKGRNAPAAEKECADLLKEGECPPPVVPMPTKVILKENEPALPINKETPPKNISAEVIAPKKALPPEDNTSIDTEQMLEEEALSKSDPEPTSEEEDVVTVPPKELIEKESALEEPAADAPQKEAYAPAAKTGPQADAPTDNPAATEAQAPVTAPAITNAPEPVLKPVTASAAAPFSTPDAVPAQNAIVPEATPESPKIMDNAVGESELITPPPPVKEIPPPAEVKMLEPAKEAAAAPVAQPNIVNLTPTTPPATPDAAPAADSTNLPAVNLPSSPPEPSPAIDAASIQENASQPMTIAFSNTVVVPGEPNKVTFFLRRSDNNSPVTLQDLKEVHTQKLHMLVIDPALKEYHHVHPVAGLQPGEYTFTFTPTGSYFRAFADVTTIGSDTNLYVKGVLGVKPVERSLIDTVTRYESSGEDNVSAVLSFDGQPKAGAAVTGKIRLVDSMGTPIKNLEPIMGTFGHIVAFSQDLSHVLHIHPLGNEPLSAMDRGGPELLFHFQPETSGFVRLFVQTKIGGKDIYIPFGFTVQ